MLTSYKQSWLVISSRFPILGEKVTHWVGREEHQLGVEDSGPYYGREDPDTALSEYGSALFENVNYK